MKILTARPHRLLTEVISRIGTLTAQGARCMLLVPSQATLRTEIEVMNQLSLSGSFTIDVLSPGRLQARVFDCAGRPDRVIFDERGKCMVLCDIIEQEKERLSIYRSAAENGGLGLAQKMSALIADFKRSGKTARELQQSLDAMDSEQRSRPAAQKLADAALIFACYEQRMAGKLCDAEDISGEMLKRMERSGVLAGQNVFICGFDMITPTFAAELVHMASLADSLTLAMETDANSAPDGRLFAPVNASLDRLCALAAQKSIPIIRERMHAPLDVPQELQYLERSLFALGGEPMDKAPEHIALNAVSTMQQEVHLAGSRMRRMMAGGEDPSQMAVVYPKGSDYAPLLASILPQYGISAYVAEKRPASAHPLCRFVTSALAVVSGGWRAQDVTECIQSGYMGLERADADALCAYIEGMDIRGDAIRRPFSYIRDGGEEALAALNASRERVAAPLASLQRALRQARGADETIEAILSLLTDVQAYETLEAQQGMLSEAGLFSEAEDCAQVMNLLMETLDQLHTLLSGGKASTKLVLELLISGLSALELAALPPADGAVICGQIGNVRIGGVKTLFVLGMNDHPDSQTGGLLTPQEQEEAAQATGAYLGMSPSERAALSQLDELKILSSCTDTLLVSYALADETGRALREGHTVQALKRLFPALPVSGGMARSEQQAMLCAPDSALQALSTALSAHVDRGEALTEIYRQAYAALRQSEAGRERLNALVRQLGSEAARRLDGSRARKLYGRPVMSVSRLEAFAQCPYRHFVRYGLAPQEALRPGVDRAELGTLYHEAAEQFTRAVTALPEFPDVSESACDALMEQTIGPLIEVWRKSPLGESERGAAIARRIGKTARRAARSIVSQFAQSRFVPFQYEMVFGQRGCAPITLELADGTFVYLQGRIDRIDVLEGEPRRIRVIDYKSGAKRFDPTMAYYGIQLQLLLYLAAAMELEPGLQAAGFFYCRIADPTVKTESRIKEEVEKQIARKLALAGISLSDVEVLREQDARHAGMITRDGKPSGLYRSSMTDEAGMQAMISFARQKAASLAQEAFSGTIEDAPAAFGTYNACASCTYSAVCGFDPTIKRHRQLSKKHVEDLNTTL